MHKPTEPFDHQGRQPPQQLLWYDTGYTSSALSLLYLRGTVFASWSVWLHVLGYVLVAAAVCAGVFLTCRQPELIKTGRISEVVFYSSGLLGLLLVLYLATAVRRWWAMRVGTLGGLWGAAGDLALLRDKREDGFLIMIKQPIDKRG